MGRVCVVYLFKKRMDQAPRRVDPHNNTKPTQTNPSNTKQPPTKYPQKPKNTLTAAPSRRASASEGLSATPRNGPNPVNTMRSCLGTAGAGRPPRPPRCVCDRLWDVEVDATAAVVDGRRKRDAGAVVAVVVAACCCSVCICVWKGGADGSV